MIQSDVASNQSKTMFAHEMAMAYMAQQDNSGLSPSEFHEKYIISRDEILDKIKSSLDPYQS